MRLAATLFVLFLAASPAAAGDEPDCDNALDQMTMNICAGLDFEKADAALNALWPSVKKAAQEADAEAGNGKTEYLDALMASQRAWLAYRDAQCNWQGFEAHVGSMEPMLVSGCLAELTNQRIKALQQEN